MDTGQNNDSYHVLSLSDADLLEELLPDELTEMNNEPGASRNTIITTAGPLISGSVTISEGENGVFNFVRTYGNALQTGRLEPRTTISSYSDPMEILDGPSSFEKNQHQINIPSFCQNQSAFQVSGFYQAQQSSSHHIPSSDQIYLTSPFDALSCFERNMHSNQVSGVHQSQQLPLVGTSNSHPAQSCTLKNFDPTQSTGTPSFGETTNSIEASFDKDQPSLGNSSLQQWDMSFDISREDQNFSAETINTAHELPGVSDQTSRGFPPHRSGHQDSISSTTLSRQPCESKLQTNHRTMSKPFSEIDTNGQQLCQSDNLEKHSSTNIDGKSFECIECHKKFSQESHLECHFSQIQSTGEKAFRCDKCDANFTLEKYLKMHYYDIHTGEKQFKCDRCDRQFINGQDLRKHYRVHTGEKPYNCNTCGRRFSQYQNLTRHYGVHNGEKPFKCNTCGKVFSRGQDLNRHYRVHSGEKPFKCNACDKVFSQIEHLRRHYRTHSAGQTFKSNIKK